MGLKFRNKFIQNKVLRIRSSNIFRLIHAMLAHVFSEAGCDVTTLWLHSNSTIISVIGYSNCPIAPFFGVCKFIYFPIIQCFDFRKNLCIMKCCLIILCKKINIAFFTLLSTSSLFWFTFWKKWKYEIIFLVKNHTCSFPKVDHINE